MPQPKKAPPVDPAVERQIRINEAVAALRPQVEAMILRMVESIVDTPEADHGGAGGGAAARAASQRQAARGLAAGNLHHTVTEAEVAAVARKLFEQARDGDRR